MSFDQGMMISHTLSPAIMGVITNHPERKTDPSSFRFH